MKRFNKTSLALSKALTFLLFLPIGILAPTRSAVAAEQAAVVQAGCEVEYPPFCIVHQDGRADGFSVELLRAALDAVGRDVEFKTGIWSEVKNWLATGQIEVLPLVGRTPEREDIFDFTFPYMTRRGAIVVRTDNKNIQTLSDLRGKNVAVMKGDNSEEFLRREDRGINIHTAATVKHALLELADGNHDAVFTQYLLAVRLLNELKPDNLKLVKQQVHEFRQDFCFAVKEGDSERLAMLNEGLSIVIANGVFQHLHAKWFAQMELPSNRSIIVGGDHNYPPFEYLDEDGNPTGYNVDLTRAIAKKLNLPVEIRLGTWAEIIHQLESGEIDVIQGMFYSRERNKQFDFSQPHMVSNYIAVTRKQDAPPPVSIDELKGKHIAVQNDDIMHRFATENDLTEQLKLFDSQEAALRALAKGEHDCALVARLTALFLIDIHGWNNLLVGNAPLLSPKYCYAVNKGEKALLATFAEGLRSIEQTGEYHAIQEKWFGIYRELGWQYILRIIAPFAIPLLIILLLGALWSWSLHKLVRTRTRELQQSEENIEQLNSVLRIISDIHQLIVRKQGCDSMINQACKLLVKSPKYATAMIVLVNDDLVPITWTQAGVPEYNQTLKKIKENGTLPICCRHNLESKRIATTVATNFVCRECPAQPTENTQALCIRLEHDNKNFGFLLVYSKPGQSIGGDEINLFTELANDIGFALRSIDTEQARQHSEKERDKLQQQVTQMQKLEAVGRLAGGVAHDFNNMLSVIIGNTELMSEDMPEDSPMQEYLQEIIRASQKSIDITRQLLAFARKQNVSPKVINLNKTVDATLQMLRRLIGEDIDLAWLPNTRVCPVKIDPTQIDQLLTNLCVNARDAIKDIGKITIETLTVTFDKQYCKEHLGFVPGKFAMLAVSDNGCGMDKKTMDQLFEPFFTTKTIDKGTGLGLATVYGVVKQNNGFINVYSEPGHGSTFKIYLPCHEDKMSSQEQAATPAPPKGHGETILLVEDNQAILRTTKQILETLDYNVIATDAGKKAIELARTHAHKIKLLITDVIMPEMNGRNLATQINNSHTDMKILYISGYTNNVIGHHGILEDGVQFLQKPFSKEELARKIKAVLYS